MEQASAFYAKDTRPFWRRWIAQLFPSKAVPIPDGLEGFAPSYMVTHVVSVLDWRDRLRVLVSGRIHVEIKTKTDVVVSEMHSESVLYVEAP